MIITHVILGLTIAEWVGVLTIVTAFMTAVYKMIFKPLMSKFDERSLAFKVNAMKKQIKLIKAHPNHVLIALLQVGIAIFLWRHPFYFQWPPPLTPFLNDHIVGFLFLATGLSILGWVLYPIKSAFFDRVMLSAAAAWTFLLAVFQLIHWIILGVEMPWISNLALTAYIFIFSYHSDNK